jgi:subtilisin family serine protease
MLSPPRLLLFPASLLLGLTFAADTAFAQAPAAPHVPGEVIVKYRTEASQNEINQINSELGGARIKGLGRIRAELRRLENLTVEEAISRYRNHPKIQYIEPNYIFEAEEVPNDPMFPQLYGMQNTGQTGGTAGADIHATQAWDVFTGSSGALVGVIDTGVDYNHPDLSANIWTNPGEIAGNGIDDDLNGYIDDIHGYDFINNDGDPMDDHGHGSHVSGTIGAVGNNGIGVAGVSWTIRIMGLKFLSASGSGSSADAVEAINYATMMGVRLTSNSWGGGGFSQALLDAINAADAAGILFIAASGNSGVNTDTSPHYPSSYASPNIIAVAATDHNDNLASFSNYGAITVDIAAPGVNILSTFPGNQYGSISGTSMATPHVSGALGLVFGRFPAIGHLNARSLILNFADPKPQLAGKCVTGGRLNTFLPIADPDDVAPGAVIDLAVTAAGSNWLQIGWSAPGDDGNTGTASRYIVKVSPSPIDAMNFDAATTAPNPPDPGPPGTPETMQVTGLTFATTYYVAVRALDEFGNAGNVSNSPAGTTLGAPDIDVAPTSLTETLLTGGNSTQLLTLSNIAEGTLDFTVPVPDLLTSPTTQQIYMELGKDETDPRAGDPVVEGFGGPDGFGYRWVDSDEPFGPAFVWNDISGIGTVALTSGDDSNAGPFPIGFPFSFYGAEFTQFRVCSNGWLSFNSTSTAYANQGLPNSGAPKNMIAPFWDDLTLVSSGDVYYHSDGSRLVVQWNAVPHYGSGGPYSFQAVLYPDGTIEYYYLSMPDPTNSATIGIHNATGTDGLQIAFNAAYVHDNMAVRIAAVPQWLTVEPTAGTVYAPGSTSLNVHFQTEGLLGGVYEANVRILSNDPDEPSFTIPVTMTVIGAPDVALDPAEFDFGQVFLGASPTTSVLVQNPGTDVLTVSNVTVDNPAYTLDMTSFTVGPHSSQAVTVTFQPPGVGIHSAVLTVTSDDPDEPTISMNLTGEGMVPPDFSVSPGSLSAALMTGETETQNLTLTNSGGANLEWNLDLQYVAASQLVTLTPPEAPTGPEADGGTPGEEARTTPIQAELADLTGVDILWDRSHGQSTTTSWSTIIADFTGRGATLTSTGTADVITPELLAGYEVVWVSDLSQMWDPPELAALVNWMAGGGGLLLEGDNAATTPIFNQLLGALNAGITVSLDDAANGVSPNIHAHPTTQNVTGVYFTAATASIGSIVAPGGPLVDDINGRSAVAYSQAGPGRIVVATDEIFQNARMSQANNQLFGNQVMDWLAGDAFLTVEPMAGTIPPGGNAVLDATFNAVGLFGGAYDANIHINTNDPAAPLVTIPAHLQVTGAPDLALNPAALDYGEVFIGYFDILEYTVLNTGTDVLTINSITSDNPVFIPDFTGVTLPIQLDPLRSTILRVRFVPTASGPTAGTVSLASNDPDTPTSMLAVSGIGRMPPAAAVTPTSLHHDLLTGQEATSQVTLSNSGNSDLEWTATRRFTNATQVFTLTTPEIVVEPDQDGGTTDPDRTTPIQAELADLTGVDILWDRTRTQVAPTSWSTIIADFTSRGATLTQTATTDVITPALLLGYDVLWSADDSEAWTADEVTAIVNWVHSGGAVLLEGDDTGTVPVYNTLLAALGAGITVSTTDGSAGISTYIHPHATTENVNGVYFTANTASLSSVTAPAGQLVDDDLGVPAVAYSQVGSGRIIVATDEIFQNARMTQANNQLFGNQVMDWLSVPVFLFVSPNSGAVPPGGSTIVNVTFDAGGLFGGDYAGTVRFLTNDPANGVLDVAATMHVTGVPRVGFDAASLDFGNVFIGYPASQSLTVQNVGTDQLSVTAITPGLADYSVSPATLELGPLQSGEVTVTFSPAAEGDRSTSLTFASNDPDSPHNVALTGTGVVPPVVGTSPDTIVGAAPPGGSKTKTLTVCNTGGSDLVFTASASEASQVATQVHDYLELAKGNDEAGIDEETDPRPGILGSGGPDMFGYTWIDSDAPGGPTYNWVDISAIGTPTGFPPYDLDGNFGPHPIGFNFPYYGSQFTEFHVSENGWISFTNGTLETYTNQALPNTGTAVPENMLAAWWDDNVYDEADNNYIVYHNDGTRLIIEFYVRRIAQTVAPYHKFQIILYPNGNIVYQYHSMGPTRNTATIGFQNATKDDGLTVVFNEGTYMHDEMAILISSRPAWLSVNPESGVVPAGGCMDLDVVMDAAELEAGDYFGLISIQSNDPANPLVSNDVVFHVGLVEATFTDVEPNTINLDSRGAYVTACVELPVEYDPADVDLSTVTLNGTVGVNAQRSSIGDFNENGIPDWIFKFNRTDVEAILAAGDSVVVTVTGEVTDVIWFTASDVIRVISPQLVSPNGGELLIASSTVPIQWTNPTGWNVDHATIIYSADGGESWSLVAENVVGTEYNWQVPVEGTTTGLIRVHLHDNRGVMGYDTSDDVFAIASGTTGVPNLPVVSQLYQNAPNPFQKTTRIAFDLPREGGVTLKVYDLSGRMVRMVTDRWYSAGNHYVNWDGRDNEGNPLASGVYFYRLQAPDYVSTLRMLMLPQ